nr:discoidin domain-containing protein [Clostridiales bacterium]
MEKYIAEHEKNVHPADGPEEIILTAEQVKGRSSAGHEAAFVLDDSFDTYYETPETESNYDYMRFLDIDLRGVYQITSITLYMVGGGYHHYQIYASETGESYRKIAFKNDSSLSDAENGDRFVFETPAKAAYLRINLSYYSTGMQDGIVRLKVFGKKTGEPVPQGPKGISVPDFKDSPWKAEWDRFRNDPEYAKEKTLREIRA